MLESLRQFGNEVHVMVDLETMSTAPNASITQIGAVAFRPGDTPGRFVRSFFTGVRLKGQGKVGLHIDEETIQWWMDQDDDAIKRVFNKKHQVDLQMALSNFRTFYEGRMGDDGEISKLPQATQKVHEAEACWGHGSTFDCVILNNAYRAIDSRAPFSFRDARDTRTVFAMVGGGDWSGGEVYGPKHDALADAMRQAVVVQRAYRTLLGS